MKDNITKFVSGMVAISLSLSPLFQGSSLIIADTASSANAVSSVAVQGGDVTIHYVDENGVQISDPEILSGSVGDFWAMFNYKKNIPGYTLIQALGTDNGYFTDQPISRTYVYKSGTTTGSIGNVTVHYFLDGVEDNNAHMELYGVVGETFNTEQKIFPGYSFKSTQGNLSGIYTSGLPQHVSYYYTKDPVPAADVTVKYVDTEGNSISNDVLLSGNVGDPYTSEQKTITGYTFKEIQGNQYGTFSDQPQTVTYIYTKDPVPAADVTVKYVDTEGNSISNDVLLSGNVGDPYTSEQKTITGYTFKEIQGNQYGTFSDQPQTVTYIYTKDPVPAADVTVKYVDTEGNSISNDVLLSGNVEDPYTSEQKTITGYTFKEVQGNPNGTFSDQPQTVIYIYTKVKNDGVNDKIPDSSKKSPTSEKQSKNNVNQDNRSNLPKTGDLTEGSSLGVVFGSISLLSSFMLGLFRRNRDKTG